MSSKTLALMWVVVLLAACFEKQEVNVPDGHLVKSASGVAHPEWLAAAESAKAWAQAKETAGRHTLLGSPSWEAYMLFLEEEFKKLGMIDMFKHQWSFDRWFTSEIPDHSKWSLVIEGKDIPVANYAAFSDESQPPKDIKAKIVVFKTKPSPKDACIESFIVPTIYGVPVLFLDENAGAQMIAAAKS